MKSTAVITVITETVGTTIGITSTVSSQFGFINNCDWLALFPFQSSYSSDKVPIGSFRGTVVGADGGGHVGS